MSVWLVGRPQLHLKNRIEIPKLEYFEILLILLAQKGQFVELSTHIGDHFSGSNFLSNVNEMLQCNFVCCSYYRLFKFSGSPFTRNKVRQRQLLMYKTPGCLGGIKILLFILRAINISGASTKTISCQSMQHFSVY